MRKELLNKRFLVVAALVGVVAVVVAFGLATVTGVVSANHVGNQINVCCAWDGNLSDGDLTYKISGGGTEAQETVQPR